MVKTILREWGHALRGDILVLTESAALGSILGAHLRSRFAQSDRTAPPIHVHHDVDTASGAIAVFPVQLLITDYEIGFDTVASFVPELRCAAPRRSFSTISLTSHVDRIVQLNCRLADVDEVIVKPMSPRFVSDRVFSYWADHHRYAKDHMGDLSCMAEIVRFPVPDEYSGDTLHPM